MKSNLSRPTYFFVMLITANLRVFTAAADTFVDYFGPDPYTPNLQSQLIQWSFSGGDSVGRGVASPFYFTGASYELNSVTLDIGGFIQNPNLQIVIFSDDAGKPSPIPIATVTPNPTLITTIERQMHTYAFSGDYVLNPDQWYWLGLQPAILNTNSSVDDAIYFSSTSVVLPYPGAAARNFDSLNGIWGNWLIYPNNPALAFQLSGVPIPEPSTGMLFGLGSLVFLCAALHRRK